MANYILQLQADKAALLRSQAAAVAAVDELRGYLSSEKFRCGDALDGYVNVSDVLSRLGDVSAALSTDVDAGDSDALALAREVALHLSSAQGRANPVILDALKADADAVLYRAADRGAR